MTRERSLEKLSLVIPGDSNELGLNKRLHWRAVHARRSQWRGKAHLAAVLAMREGECRQVRGKVKVSFVVRRPRMLDPQNVGMSYALKAILDGLVDAGLLRGDTERHVTMGAVTQEKAIQPEVEVILEEVA